MSESKLGPSDREAEQAIASIAASLLMVGELAAAAAMAIWAQESTFLRLVLTCAGAIPAAAFTGFFLLTTRPESQPPNG